MLFVRWITVARFLGKSSVGRMLKKERAAYVDEELERLYPNPPIPLDHSDSYTLLVAVLLSAQCTDIRVNQITPGLWALADNPEAMAKQAAKDAGAQEAWMIEDGFVTEGASSTAFIVTDEGSMNSLRNRGSWC